MAIAEKKRLNLEKSRHMIDRLEGRSIGALVISVQCLNYNTQIMFVAEAELEVLLKMHFKSIVTVENKFQSK